jgi:hypothetical protein
MGFKKKHLQLITFIFIILIISVSISYVNLGKKQVEPVENTKIYQINDKPSILPDWNDGEYHDYDATNKVLNSFNQKYPDLVEITSLGKSVLGKDIMCVCLTNESISSNKYSCLIDGCIHGNEWETV